MSDVEILIIGTLDKGSPEAETAGVLQKHLLGLGASVRRVTSLDPDIQLVADEISAVLRRAPDLMVLVGGTDGVAPAGLATATECELCDAVPAGAFALEGQDGGMVMLVATTHVVVLPSDPSACERVWEQEIGHSVAEWFGQPPHTSGELIVLGGRSNVLVGLLDAVSRQHPAVNIHSGPHQPGGGVRVVAMTYGRGERSRQAVDAALAEIERSAAATRLQISSSGRLPGHDAGSAR